MTAIDPNHWLYRLDSAQWLAAADHELRQSREALRGKHHRPGLAHARRAAGMALNAVLVVQLDDRYGRSYVDHLRALRDDDTVPGHVREAARALLVAPIQQAPVVTLGAQGSTALADAADVVVSYARRLVHPDARS